MPQVPYSPVPDVRPDMGGTPGLRVQANPAAFGETVAQAIQHLGNVGEQAGNEMFQRAVAIQDVNNRAEADQAVANYMETAGKLHADFNSLEGKAAADGLDGHIQQLKSAREDIANSLSNPAAKRLYDTESRGFLGRTIFNASGHAAQQQKVYANGAAEAVKDQVKQDVFTNPGDTRTFKQNLRRVEEVVRGTQAAVHGWSPEQTDEIVGKDKSSMMMLRIQGLAKTQPFAAKQLLDNNEGLLRAEDFVHAQNTVQTQLYSTGARMIADEVNPVVPEGQADKSLREKVDTAITKAEKIAPNDPVFKTYVESQVRAIHHQRVEVKKEDERQAAETVADAIINSDAVRFDQLRATPGFDKAWNTLDRRSQQTALRTLADKAEGDYKLTPEASDRIQQLRGMATDPNSDFLTTPILNEKIPWKDKQRLWALQKQIRGGSQTDPRVQHAMSVLQSDLFSANLLRAQDQDGYYKFRGALQDALNYQTDQLGKKLSDKEVLEVGRKLIQDVKIPGYLFQSDWVPGFLGGPSKEPFFKMKLPDEEVQKVKDQIKQQTGREPDEAEIQRKYIQMRYIEHYGGSVKPEQKAPKLGG